MCGIVGVGLAGEPAPELVERLLDSIGHRGPDAAGHVCRAGALLRDLQIVERRPSLPISPWRALSLASLPEQTGLAA